MLNSFKPVIKSVLYKAYKIHCDVMLNTPIELIDALQLYFTLTINHFRFNINRINKIKIK
ncbi:MAG: hypothetical protein QXF12_05985 [Candidatus Aenigmatarchaeota archaeon]